MGLGSNTNSRIFLSISDGKIAQRFNEETAGAVKCNNKEGTKTWWEKRYANVTGMVTGVSKRTTDYGDKLNIVIEDAGDTFQLEMPWSSRYSSGFFLCMPNIDWSKPVTFTPWMKIVDGVKKSNLYIQQDGQDIKWFWTKENQGDLPAMVQVIVKGQTVWDDTARQAYFEKYVNEKVLPQLKARPQAAAQVEVVEDEGIKDDLPF